MDNCLEVKLSDRYTCISTDPLLHEYRQEEEELDDKA